MLLFILTFAFWSAVHSITASRRFKAYIASQAGTRFYRGWYRLLYNAFSALSILPLLVIGSLKISDQVIWSVPPPLRYGFYAVQLVGLLGLMISLWQTGFLQFAGLSQAISYIRDRELEESQEVLVTGGAYALVRHPLYFFSLLIIWFFPTMTLQLLVFNALTTIYFILGSVHEERRLQTTFGVDYEIYRAAVPALIPIRIRLLNRS